MAESERAPLYVISGDEVRAKGIVSVLHSVMADHQAFSALMVVAVIPTGDPEFQDCRVYATNLNHLEKIGLLHQAEDTIK